VEEEEEKQEPRSKVAQVDKSGQKMRKNTFSKERDICSK